METRYTIEGMDCADCASKIEAAASRVNGITGASASLGAKRLVVTHSKNTDLDDLPGKIKRLGYRLTPQDATARIRMAPAINRTNPGGNTTSFASPVLSE